MENTYAIAFGPSNASHESVEKMFADELSQLKSGKCQFYHGNSRKMIRIYADVFVTLKDQPERRSSNHILDTSSRCCPRWGYSVDCSGHVNTLPSCRECRITPNRLLCNHCYHWDLEKIKFNPPLHYPKELFIDTHNQVIPCKKITYDSLIGSVNFAISRFTDVNNPWNVSTLKAYLKCVGVNTNTITDIIDHARRNLQWSPPVLWTRGSSLDDHIDVPMHLLFLFRKFYNV